VNEEATTGRGRIRGVYVLVVHDEGVSVERISSAVHDAFVVREATDAFDALERLSGAPLACVVCVIGGSIRGEDFFKLVSRAAPEQAKRVVFVTDDEREVEFLRDSGASWLPSTAESSEILALVRAVAAQG
jgi:DNA-binding NarL/FixJ family response regulator